MQLTWPVSRSAKLHEASPGAACWQVRYTYYTAGSGGVGPTIMETSMLLAGTEVVVFKDGERVSSLHWGLGAPGATQVRAAGNAPMLQAR